MRKVLRPEIKKALETQMNSWNDLRASIGKEDPEIYNRYSHYITGFVTALGIMNISLVHKDDKWIIADKGVKDETTNTYVIVSSEE